MICGLAFSLIIYLFWVVSSDAFTFIVLFSFLNLLVTWAFSFFFGLKIVFHFIDDELISPCMCKGTQQFVHRSCLDHWRSVKASILSWGSSSNWFRIVKIFEGWKFIFLIDLMKLLYFPHSTVLCPLQEGFAFSHCTTCKAQYHLQVALFEDNSWRKIKFRLFVARDVFLVFLAVQTVSSVKFA